ncbi:MAG: hypothetical protein LBT37_05860 [Lactobacillaceae bacterium]|jgi:hypothetical protein|nr:hypothetical protein [Lactobacillaceae bacterium]
MTEDNDASYKGYKNYESYLLSKEKYQKKISERLKNDPEVRKRKTMVMYRAYGKNYVNNTDDSNSDLRAYGEEINRLIDERIAERENKHN